jgi:hypothetical protein
MLADRRWKRVLSINIHTLLLLIFPLGSYLSRRGVPLHSICVGLLVLRD